MEEHHEGHSHSAEHAPHHAETHAHAEHAAHEAHTGEHAHEAHAAHPGGHPHGAPSHGGHKTNDQYLWFAIGAAALIIIVSAFFAAGTINQALEDLRNISITTASPTPVQTPTSTPAPPTPTPTPLVNVTITEIADGSCADCFNISVVTSSLERSGAQLGMRVAVKRRVDINSTDGRALLSTYNITKVPTILISKEARGTMLMEVWNESGTVESDGTLVLREVYPPYIDMATGHLMWKVNVTFLTAPNCTQCYDIGIHRSILLQRFSIAVASEKNVSYDSTEGRALVARYNITSVPTVLISPEMGLYPGMEQLWLEGLIGSKESDGWYIFRNMAAMGNVTFFNVTSNTTVTLNQTET